MGGEFRIGTRGSALALRQAEIVRDLLRGAHPSRTFSLTVISTRGDRILDRPIWQLGDKGVFVRPIEIELLEGRIDLAVHSLKDVPAESGISGLVLSAFTPREDPRDVLISRSGSSLSQLGAGARVGTSSMRRRVQLREVRPDLDAKDIRGNVDSRLRKLADRDFDAVLLAAAGLIRLGQERHITEYLPVPTFTPDAGQGIVGVQTREDGVAKELVAAIDDPAARVAGTAERAVVRSLGAGCHSPVGAFAQIQGDRVQMVAMAAREDGSDLHRVAGQAGVSEAEGLGEDLGLRLKTQLATSQS